MKNFNPPPTLTKNKAQIALWSVLIFADYFGGLGTVPFLGPDEPRYAEVAREMFLRGDFVTTTLGGLNWFEKPALAYWLMMAGYKIFGVNEFAARFGSALFGLLTIGTIYLLCRFVATHNTVDDAQTAKGDFPFWGLPISVSSVGLLAFSHAATFDIILTFPMTAALACFFAFDIQSSKFKAPSLKFLIGSYFFVGVALLAKGLIGAVLPLGIVFGYFVLSRKLPSKKILLSLLWGTLLTCATAATWYAPMLLRHGSDFFNEFFMQQQFARYASNKYLHPEPVWFFWVILPLLTLPWLPFFAIAIWKIVLRKNPKAASARDFAGQNLRLFALVWMIIPLIFFTFSGSKLPGYILPALPAALILAAEQVEHFVKNNQNRRLVCQIVAIIILLAVPISLNTFAVELARHDTTKFLLEAAQEQGLSDAKVLNLHDISHSLEFYAAGRLVRLPDGKQWKFEGTREIWNYLQLSRERSVLVLVPLEHEHQLYETDLFTARKIADNGAFALVAVDAEKYF